MLKKIIHKLSYIRKAMNGNTQQYKEPHPNASLTGKLYLNITELSLDKFIRCLCDGELSVLVRDWHNVTELEIHAAWSGIYDQYLDCIKDREQEYILKLSKEINLLETKLNLIQLIVNRLALQHSPEILDELKKIVAISEKFDINDIESYMRDLEMVVTRSKRLFVELQTKKSEFEKLMPKEAGAKVNKQDFERLITKLSRYMKFRVNKYEIMVSEFVEYIVDMRATSEALDREMKNLKR